MTLEFREDIHEYQWNGRVVPSVTQTLKRAGLLREYATDSYAWRGTAVHLACELDDRGELDDSPWNPETGTGLDDRIRGYLASWRQFRDAVILDTYQPVLIEHRCYHEGWGVAGTIDRIYPEHGGRGLVLDAKSGQPQWTDALQLSAYAALSGLRDPARWNVYLDADGAPATIVRHTSDAEDRAAWLAALSLARYKGARNVQ